MQIRVDKNSIKEKAVIVFMIMSAFAGIYYTIGTWLKLSNQEWVANLQEERSIVAEKLATEADTEYFITYKVLPLLKYLCDNPEENIDSLREQYLKNYDLDLSIYRFDSSKKLRDISPKKAPNQWLVRNMFPLLTETNIEKINLSKKELDKKIEFAFGHGKDLISIQKSPEIVVNTVCSGKDCFFAWSYRPTGGAIIYGNRFPDKDKVFKYALSRINSKDLLYANELVENNDTEETREAVSADRHFNRISVNCGEYNGKNWIFVNTKNNRRYYTAYKIVTSIYVKGLNFLRLLFFVLIPAALLVLASISQSAILSLKKMVILIFIASAILPLTEICGARFESIDAYSNIYKNSLKSSMEEAIGNIIQHFNNYLMLCTKELMTLTEPADNKYDFVEMEKKVTKAFPKSRFDVRDAASLPIYCNAPAFAPGQEELTKAIYNVYIERNSPSRLSEAKYKANPFADALVRKDDMGFSWLTKNPNELTFVNNGGSKILMFTRLLPKEAGKAAVLNIQPDLETVMKDYVKSIDPRTLVSRHQQIKLFAFNPLKFRWQISPVVAEMQFLELAKAAYITGKPIFRKITANDQTVFSLCIPNSDIDEICYIGSLPIDDFLIEIRRQKLYIGFCAIIAFILLIAIISWLMKQLIAPLSNLEIGIQALAQRKFETTIPVPSGNDELAQLFKEFNFMMGESYDMQIAQNVQEGLITQKFPESENYKIAGITIPAGNLGGDCLTSFALPDGKILFMVGDLTGHSIGSALMMAFVRAVTFNWSQQPSDDPATLVEKIDNLLRENKMENMFMGIVCGILNPTDGKISFVTNGHIYPLFLRKSGRTEWLGSPSFPLGIGKKKEIITQETYLQPGDRMLCISDGLIEINNYGGITTGYELIEDWAIKSKSANDWIVQIKECFADWCKEKKVTPTDDTTIFAIISKGVSE